MKRIQGVFDHSDFKPRIARIGFYSMGGVLMRIGSDTLYYPFAIWWGLNFKRVLCKDLKLVTHKRMIVCTRHILSLRSLLVQKRVHNNSNRIIIIPRNWQRSTNILCTKNDKWSLACSRAHTHRQRTRVQKFRNSCLNTVEKVCSDNNYNKADFSNAVQFVPMFGWSRFNTCNSM